MTSEDDSSNDERSDEAVRSGLHIFELGPHDVVLGRGSGPSMQEGNVKFRKAVEALKPAYIGTKSRKEKKHLVRRTVEDIKARNGRFVIKLQKPQLAGLRFPHKEVYEIVKDNVACEKTKQAVRYVHYKKEPADKKRSEEGKVPSSLYSYMDGPGKGCKENGDDQRLRPSKKRVLDQSLIPAPIKSAGNSSIASACGFLPQMGPPRDTAAGIGSQPTSLNARSLGTLQSNKNQSLPQQSLLSRSHTNETRRDGPPPSSSYGSYVEQSLPLRHGSSLYPLSPADLMSNVFPTPLNPAVEGILLNQQLNSIFSSGSRGTLPNQSDLSRRLLGQRLEMQQFPSFGENSIPALRTSAETSHSMESDAPGGTQNKSIINAATANCGDGFVNRGPWQFDTPVESANSPAAHAATDAPFPPQFLPVVDGHSSMLNRGGLNVNSPTAMRRAEDLQAILNTRNFSSRNLELPASFRQDYSGRRSPSDFDPPQQL